MPWRLASSRQLLVRSWEGESVVYDCAAGDTHLLGTAAAAVLAQLQGGPYAQDAHGAQGAQRAPSAPDAGILAGLAALGLIEPAA